MLGEPGVRLQGLGAVLCLGDWSFISAYFLEKPVRTYQSKNLAAKPLSSWSI